MSPPHPVSPVVPRFGPPLVLQEERGVSWEQLQQSILAQLRALLRGEVRAQVSRRGDTAVPCWGHLWTGLLALQPWWGWGTGGQGKALSGYGVSTGVCGRAVGAHGGCLHGWPW